jgi:hypothetical protein
VTIGVGVALVLGVVDVGAEPTGTIGVGGVEVLVESELDEGVAGGGFWPLGMTIGVGLAPPLLSPLSLSESEPSCGGQSTEVGGQLSVLPDPDDEPGGAQPEPAPKSPAPVQSAYATPTGSTTTHPTIDKAAATIRIREVFTASGCPRRR